MSRDRKEPSFWLFVVLGSGNGKGQTGMRGNGGTEEKVKGEDKRQGRRSEKKEGRKEEGRQDERRGEGRTAERGITVGVMSLGFRRVPLPPSTTK